MKVKVGEIEDGKNFKYEDKIYTVIKPVGVDGYYYGLQKIFTTRKNVVLAVEAKKKYKTKCYAFEKDEEVVSV